MNQQTCGQSCVEQMNKIWCININAFLRNCGFRVVAFYFDASCRRRQRRNDHGLIHEHVRQTDRRTAIRVKGEPPNEVDRILPEFIHFTYQRIAAAIHQLSWNSEEKNVSPSCSSSYGAIVRVKHSMTGQSPPLSPIIGQFLGIVQGETEPPQIL